MNIPSFVRKPVRRFFPLPVYLSTSSRQSRSASTRSITPPPTWLAPHLTQSATKVPTSDRPNKRRKTSIAHSVTSASVPVGDIYSSPALYHHRDKFSPDESASNETRPFATNGTAQYFTPASYAAPTPTGSIYELQLDRFDHYSSPAFQSDPTLCSQDYSSDPHFPPAHVYPQFPDHQLANSNSIYASPLHSMDNAGATNLQWESNEKQIHLQERLENVVDDLTNFWKTTRGNQVGLSSLYYLFGEIWRDGVLADLDCIG